VRAVALNEYGGPEVLEVMDLPEPKVGPDVVLVRTRAAGVNPVDYKMREGGVDARFPSHFPLIPGWDVAGTVEEVGPDVAELRPGDEVIGYVRRATTSSGAPTPSWSPLPSGLWPPSLPRSDGPRPPHFPWPVSPPGRPSPAASSWRRATSSWSTPRQGASGPSPCSSPGCWARRG
jgi:Alcohol dehydrogenase GroES-like domain